MWCLMFCKNLMNGNPFCRRASSIYVNIFSGESTTKLPTATQMARGGVSIIRRLNNFMKLISFMERGRIYLILYLTRDV